MIKKLCIFTISFAFNRQGLINFIEKTAPKETELFLFVPEECKGKYYSKRIKIYESNKSKYSCILEFRKFCNDNGIDRIINLGSLPQEGFFMFFASALKERDFICYLVIDPLEFLNQKISFWSIKSFFQTISLPFLSFFSKKFLVCSKDIEEIGRRFLKRISSLPDTVNMTLFQKKDKNKIRKKLKLNKKDKIIIFVGRLIYEKGVDLIIKLAIKNPQIVFILIGGKDERLKIPNISNLMILKPMKREELADYYNASDLCLFPSRGEGFGLVPREAMACGVPSLVSDIRGLRMIEPTIKVPLGIDSIEEFDKRIKQFFLLSKKERDKLSKISREFVVSECSEEICKNLYIEKLLN